MRTHLQGVGLQIQTLKSVDAMHNAMRNAVRAMTALNKRMNIPQLGVSSLVTAAVCAWLGSALP